MREIKFRGKRKIDDKLVYGDLLQYKYSTAINDDFGHDNTVYPKTVGQFTGLRDKNGAEIYEGDIISFTLFDVYGNDSTYIGEVAFENGEYVIKSEHEHGNEGLFGLWDVWYNDEGVYLEVVGNIHQHKDLLTKTVEDVEKERSEV